VDGVPVPGALPRQALRGVRGDGFDVVVVVPPVRVGGQQGRVAGVARVVAGVVGVDLGRRA